ncbi:MULTISPECIES: HAMP domain-containing protein [Limnospira]|uniref:HAMP domain-containing protein n=2 Tax=Sirenicapillariaceae TaxID=2934961 RepID=UPI00028046D0|nr:MULTISPECIES: HAMP domain-containing protein [unclassified Limnospira]EKD08865.1 putative sensor with HAMP domain protein [Arthrospira platensis C1]MDY7053752.1 HAMP domain-containing protein [Limnospira fusiformis LS22]QNH57467.1 MAG: HAMP domain-containing protein [Limnospira indica BM01]MDT9188191.1 HAMP domain-containing protein [Limnospira sp. PMC 894.15]MDT9234048.1 HAMP domain-containing protein [Limnospira sp. PMC 917.15]
MGKFQGKRVSLVQKLTIAMTRLVIIVVTSVTWLSLQLQQHSFKQELEQQANILLETISIASAEPLEVSDVQFLTRLMEQLGTAQILVSGHIYQAEGRVIADVYNSEIFTNDIDLKPGVVELLKTSETLLNWQYDNQQLLGGKAVTFNGKIVGAVSVGLSTQPLENKMATVRNQGLIIAMIAAIAGACLASIISRSITEPLKQMTAATKELAAGDLELKIDLQSQDELQVLADSFNKMTKQLRDLVESKEQLITSLELRAEALRKSEVKNRALLNAIPDLMLRFNQEGLVLDFQASRRIN